MNNKIQLLVPNELKPLAADVISEKYPDPNQRPSVILSDKQELVTIKIIPQPQKVNDNEVAEYKKFHMSHMKQEDGIEWLADGVKIINGKKIGFFKVIYTDKNTFAYLFFTSFEGNLLLFSFNCQYQLFPVWENTVEKIVNSLKIL
jgi:hypothetical protein